jgi:hypothetical protein
MIRFVQILILFCLLVLCPTVFGQIELSYAIRKTIVGATNSELLPGGRILIDDDSKISSSIVAEIRAASLKPYKFTARKTLDEFVELIPLPDLLDSTSKQVTKRFLLVGTGTFLFEATSRSDDIDRSLSIVIGAPTPKPPTPDPTPPDPPKPDDVVPIPADGLRVLIVFEMDDVNKYKPSTRAIISGASMRSYLDSVCVKNSANVPEYRVFDKDTVAEAGLWKNALARPRKSVPWIVVSNGKRGFEGPLPETEAETQALIARYK